MRRLTVLALLLAAATCEDTSYRSIGAEINVLTKRSQDPQAPPARRRLTAHGRRAIPQIETALHTAPEPGRLHLVGALEAIGDPEAIPILRHFAVYDASDAVRAACEKVLAAWSTGTDPRAQQARAAAARVSDLRSKGETPTPPRR